MPGDTSAVHLIITGRVQGVGYRAWCQGEAEARGLSGWVRNRRDGSVEAVVRGGAQAVAEFVAACHEGPTFAKVTGVAQKSAPADADLPQKFEQRPTA